ncbi:uncharacterized protein LOC128261654 [Drosophila gunungcola]|uniref:Uncharacterized protein n=1 Tax=Drosophila gunungcola TaxID=103775 RepID=A0A9Q0BT84_9MUSC|nr:uncharacterized protein LOC128261654 [Drosophila gunungcola]KAI8042964.1 hypothetical protein M5D96_004288 [Drosophila gunungcola]
MSRSAYLLCVLFLGASCLVFSASAARNYRKGYKTTEPPTTPPPPQTPKEYLDSRPGISTFGIIAIIFTVIVLCLIFYYGIICYPLLCRDEKKYRFMDVSSTITAATSRSIQSIENYPDQKHHHQLA